MQKKLPSMTVIDFQLSHKAILLHMKSRDPGDASWYYQFVNFDNDTVEESNLLHQQVYKTEEKPLSIQLVYDYELACYDVFIFQ